MMNKELKDFTVKELIVFYQDLNDELWSVIDNPQTTESISKLINEVKQELEKRKTLDIV